MYLALHMQCIMHYTVTNKGTMLELRGCLVLSPVVESTTKLVEKSILALNSVLLENGTLCLSSCS